MAVDNLELLRTNSVPGGADLPADARQLSAAETVCGVESLPSHDCEHSGNCPRVVHSMVVLRDGCDVFRRPLCAGVPGAVSGAGAPQGCHGWGGLCAVPAVVVSTWSREGVAGSRGDHSHRRCT